MGQGLAGYADANPEGLLSNAFVRGAVGNAMSQGIGVVTGLQSSFNWMSVAAAGASSQVGETAGGMLSEGRAFSSLGGGLQQLAQSAVRGFAAGAPTAAIRLWP